ncbi:CheR family methyltransferase [Bordetella bronchialis]|uniref:Chemotaxis protein n=1 Tax=Bordetella bronchialis TaxID=463025 RepID=A0A193FUK2_9BORD|nr:CheR family methyltransferase [Bordetella bronchialis]ANN70719.1 chemotaxis protein [Bordetella bronchialis]
MSNNEPPPRNRSTALPSHLPFPVVGIGASAGAVETLKVFFENMPSNPGMAFVVVVHLSPKHESVLDRILQTCTSMPVVQVTKHTSIEADHVYVIPPAARLEMNDSYLRVQHAVRAQGDPVAIDEFFRTLADVHKTRAVGIVLTGGGSDGSVGLSRIKEQGGITLAQDPDDAMHDTMPRSAIATGAVDIVLPVSAIPARLLAIAKNMGRIHIPPPADLQRDAGERPDEGHETANDRAALRDILAMLRARTGHDFKHYKKATVLRRIERRMQVTGLPDMPAYAAMLHEKPDETPKLLSDMLIGVTQFFRDRESFEILEQRIVGNLFGGDNGPVPTHVRTWVAGCSSGEEAYSVAMLLCAEADARNAAPKIQVFATDIDEFSLVIGRAGVYPGAIETDVPAARLQQFFTREGSNYRVRKELRERVLFAPHNVLRDPPFSKLDLVSCRNLLIYLDREVQADVLRMFHFALKPGGYLFLGSSESADACENLFAVVDKRHRIYQAKNTASQHRPVPLLPIAGTDKLPQASVPVHAVRGNRTSFADIHRQALEHYAPPSVIVDRDSNIVHMSERAGRFLRHVGGEPSRSLPALVYPDLRMELRTALFQALHSHKSVEARRVAMTLGDSKVYINMIVRPFRHDETGNEFMLVIFDEVDAVMSTHESDEESRVPSSVLAQLEAELQRTKEQLQLTMEQSETSTEELKASNEELQAINEELRSTTEELETGKEELQSVNEELITVNSELKSKVEETAKINDDLQNLIASTDIATVFVDRGMRIKWFTLRATDIFSVIANDAGRSLLDITHRLDYPDLAQDAAAVFESLRTIEREVRSADNRWFLARLLPYRSAEHRIEGAVLTFIDVTARRNAEARINAMAQSTKDFAIITMGQDGVITTWNMGAQQMFGYAETEAVGQHFSLIFTQEDIDAAIPRHELERARREGYAPDERWHKRKDGTRLFCVGGINPIDDPLFTGYAKIARDITAQKHREMEQESRLESSRADNTLKDEFFAVMSHELKHPLNLIQLNAELLVRTPQVRATASAARAADAIQRAVRSQARIIEDLLDIARAQTGKLKLNRSTVSLVATVDGIVNVVQPTVADVGVTLDKAYDLNTTLYIDADPVRVEQIVWNLINNGIKFTPPEGTVTIRLDRDGQMARLTISDTGEGIDPEFLPRLFEMYSQDRGQDGLRGRMGLGIGLAVVHQLVQAHGGRIEAASDGKGKGSTFTVWLPLSAHAYGPADPAGVPPEAAALEGIAILLVDDSPEILDTFGALLEMEGARVDTASSGQAGLDALARTAFDIVISDLGMPEMDGYGFLNAMRQKNIATPAIALSGYGAKRDVDKAMSAGFTAHLGKPVPLEQLVKVIRQTLAREETRQAGE